jgi:predicted DNA binding CopG/RHH family protein
MQDAEPNADTKPPVNFASLLASFTAPARQSSGLWDDSDLGQDISTISYEQALHTHSRAHDPDPLATPPSAAPANLSIWEDIEIAQKTLPAVNRKAASVTIRLGQAQLAQLHQRAAAAGLTVSAYLRSCIFETENLRAEVKQALSQMRALEAVDPGNSDRRESTSWRARLFPHWSRPSRTARA